MTDVNSLEHPIDFRLQIAALEKGVGHFIGKLLQTTRRETREPGEALVREQAQELIDDHRIEVARNLKDKRRESIIKYVRYLSTIYTNDSLCEFHMYAPELLGREYAEAHHLNVEERVDDVVKVTACFKDAIFLGYPFSSIYEFEDDEELQGISWDQLWSACDKALEVEVRKKKYLSLNIEFSDQARTLGCFVATALIASDLNR